MLMTGVASALGAPVRLINALGAFLFHTQLIYCASESKAAQQMRVRVARAWQALRGKQDGLPAAPPAASFAQQVALLALLLLSTPLVGACMGHLRGGSSMLLVVVDDKHGAGSLIAAGQQLRRRGMRLCVRCGSGGDIGQTERGALRAGLRVSVLRGPLLCGRGRRALLLGPAPRRRLGRVLASGGNRLQRCADGEHDGASGTAALSTLLQLVQLAEGEGLQRNGFFSP